MKAKTAERLRLAAIALGAASVLVFAPLVAGATVADTTTGVAVVNLGDYPQINKDSLSVELADVDSGQIDRLIVISPWRPSGGESSECGPVNLKALCDLSDEVGEPLFVPYGANPVAALDMLPDTEPEKADDGALVTTLHQDVGSGFGWWRSVQVGLLMTIIAAASLYYSGVTIQRRRRGRAGAHGQVVTPALSVPTVPGSGRPAESPVTPAPAPPASQPAPRSPARNRRPAPAPPPRPGPLPAEIPGAIRAGRRVVARTPFGREGGFVDADGLLLWATPEQPGEDIHPGRPLSVVGVGADAVIVSSRITEEVRR